MFQLVRQIKNFDGGDLSSDAGLLLIKEFAAKIGFTKPIKLLSIEVIFRQEPIARWIYMMTGLLSLTPVECLMDREHLLLLKENPSLTQVELSEMMDRSRRTVQMLMKELLDEGVIERIGSKKRNRGS